MRLSHLTLLHKGQTSTRYYRWMTRCSTLLILMTTIFSDPCLSQLEFNPFSLIPRSGGWVWVQSYATIVHNRSSHSLPFSSLFQLMLFLLGCVCLTVKVSLWSEFLTNWRIEDWIEFLSFQPFLTTSLHRGGQLCSVWPRARWPCSECWTGGR